MLRPSEVSVSDPVQFEHGGSTITGHLVRKSTRKALVAAADGREFGVPWNLLQRHEQGEQRRVTSRVEELKAQFLPGDAVRFRGRAGALGGTIARLGPKRAVVTTANGEYRVPYGMLEFAGEPPARNGGERLAGIAREADRLLVEHGLEGWSFQFDDAASRAGSCDFQKQVITLAHQYGMRAADGEVRNTILHEIAHALVGPKHHHDSVWKAAARSIGCTGDRCHNVRFAPPVYTVSCPRCGWRNPAKRRRRNLVCKTCRRPVTYERYVEADGDRPQAAA